MLKVGFSQGRDGFFQVQAQVNAGLNAQEIHVLGCAAAAHALHRQQVELVGQLREAGLSLPLTVSEDDGRWIEDAQGGAVLLVDPDNGLPNVAADRLARLVVWAVNNAAGLPPAPEVGAGDAQAEAEAA